MNVNQEACLFSGTSHPELAELVAEHSQMELGQIQILPFPDGEISVQLKENVRGKSTFVVQSLAHKPNYYLMELLIIIDALKRASAQSISVIIPYFAYSRQDRKDKRRVPITARLVANLLEKAGATQVITLDLHADQIQGFFDIPSDNLYARPAFVERLKELQLKSDETVVGAPDIGSIRLVKSMADQLKTDFIIIDKRRLSSTHVEMSPIIGDVRNKTVIFVDDICSTATTLCKAAEAVMQQGATQVYAVITHGLFMGDALEKIEQSKIKKVFVSDSIPLKNSEASSKIEVVSTAHLFGEGIRCVLQKKSMSSLFTP